jgi:hypothetical protein
MWTHFCSCVSLGAGIKLLARPTISTFHLLSAHFLIALRICLGLPHPTVAHLSQCQCGHTIDNLGTHLLRCPCGSEHITAHNTLWNIVATIALESKAHVQKEVCHLFPRHTRQQVDILITKNGFHALLDLVIANPTHTNMVQRESMKTTHATTMATQKKTRSYIIEHQAMTSFPLLLRRMGVFIFYHLCTDHYYASSTVFFSPVDVHFPLLTTCVRNPATCKSHKWFFNELLHLVGVFHFFHTS